MAEFYEIRGVEALDRKLANMLPIFARAGRRAVADTVLFAEVEIANQIDSMEAVDTGRLKGSVSAKMQREPGDSATQILPGGLAAVVGTNVAYAIPVHDGYTRTLKGGAVRSAYGAARGRFTRKRVAAGERSSKRQANLRISGASYSRDELGGTSMHVQGRPFMDAAVPAIERRFGVNVETQIGGIL